MNNYIIKPLLDSQKRIFFLSQSEKSSSAYNNFAKYRLNGEIDHLLLNEAIKKSILRHPSLRSNFSITNNNLTQIFSNYPKSEEFLNTYDFTSNSIDINSWIKNYYETPFNIYEGSLYRFSLLKVGGNTYYFLICMHHIISDAYSFTILLDEIFMFYNKLLKDKTSEQSINLDNEYYRYLEYSNNNDNNLNDSIFWKGEFKSWMGNNTYLYYDFINDKSFTGCKKHFLLTNIETERIKTVSKRNLTTVYCFLNSVFQILINKITAEKEIITGTILSGRNNQNNNLFGMFVNTLPVVTTINPELSFLQFLKSSTKKLADIYQHQYHPLTLILEPLSITREGNKNPLFESVFTMQYNFPDYEYESFSATYENHDKESSIFDLLLEAYLIKDEILFQWQYDTLLFRESTIETFSNLFKSICNQVLNNVDVKLKNIVFDNETIVSHTL